MFSLVSLCQQLAKRAEKRAEAEKGLVQAQEQGKATPLNVYVSGRCLHRFFELRTIIVLNRCSSTSLVPRF